MKYSTYTWDLVRARESASPASCKTPATLSTVFKKFSALFIEEHAADCSSKFNLLYNNFADETYDGKIDINK